MKIENIYIKNFRSIKETNISFKNLTMIIGNNGTGKTSILEALNYALSPSFLSGKIEPSDFYNGTNENIIIEIEFFNTFEIEIPDFYSNKQKVKCKKIHLEIKKRERAAPNKSFSDGFVISNYYVPVEPKTNEKGWTIKRQNGSNFSFSELQLSFNHSELVEGLRCFYFNKSRNIQIKEVIILH